MLYRLLDIFFLLFHTLLIAFNMLGWICKSTRKWHLLTLGLTLFSWLALGFWYGWGYCFLTDWHWDVLRELGEYPPESSYIQYLFRRLAGIKLSAQTADAIAVAGLALAVLAAGVMQWKERRIQS